MRTYGEIRSFPIPVWNGIFDHRPRIGSALWVFLWCLDRITSEDSGVGFVLGGANVTAGKIARELHDSERTVRRHLKRLAEHGYVALKRNPCGFFITVSNSCKFDIWRPDKKGRPDRTKMPVRPDKSAGQTDKSVRPNKEDSAVDSAGRQNLPPNPPKGGPTRRDQEELTSRERKELRREMDRLAQAWTGRLFGDEDLLRAACDRLVVPLDLAREAVRRSRGELTA